MNRFCLFVSIIALFIFSYGLSAQSPQKTDDNEDWGDASVFEPNKRTRAESKDSFQKDNFKDNLYIGAFGMARIPNSENYSFTYSAGASALKWVSRYVGVRVDLSGGYMNSNLTGDRLEEFSAGASALFNVTSYISGYDRRRFCEVSTVMGVGYSCWWDLMTAHYFTGNVGANVNLRINDRFSLYVEPYFPLHLNAGGLNYGFATKVGAYYDLSSDVYQPTIARKYFVSLSAGVQTQNSALVKFAQEKDYSTLGMNLALGAGRHFNDYLSLRLSALYSRHMWTVYYGGQKMPANYFAFSIEGMFDALRLIMEKCDKENFPLGCGIAMGPEAGCMVKKDLDENLSRHYVGFTGAMHVNYRFGERYSVFMEPRLRILPYSAPHDMSTANNAYRNYYDGLFDFSIGLEVRL